jgi:hypothetical protein
VVVGMVPPPDARTGRPVKAEVFPGPPQCFDAGNCLGVVEPLDAPLRGAACWNGRFRHRSDEPTTGSSRPAPDALYQFWRQDDGISRFGLSQAGGFLVAVAVDDPAGDRFAGEADCPGFGAG